MALGSGKPTAISGAKTKWQDRFQKGNPMRFLFKRRPDRFITLIIKQAEVTLKGLDLLKEYMETRSHETAIQLKAAEKEADEVRRILVDELNRTFITPIDREDIFALSRAVDDMIDYAYTTVDEMEILKVKPTEHMTQIATLLRDAASAIHLAVQRLESHPNVATEHAQRAKSLENRVENLYREALADLFSGPENIKQVVKMLKTREVYRHLSNAADKGDEAANVIWDIVVKMV
jgi:predicted phosphate transport protein (TIGR00153 family)